jgi:hypothetical protein
MFFPLGLEYWMYGVHFTDKLFDADVFELNGEKANWQVHYVDHAVGDLAELNLEENKTWQVAQRVALAFKEADVSVPVFGLQVIGSAVNQCMNLYGQKLIEAMLLEPEAARHDLKIMGDMLGKLHRWYLDTLPAEPRYRPSRSNPSSARVHARSLRAMGKSVAALPSSCLRTCTGSSVRLLTTPFFRSIPTAA